MGNRTNRIVALLDDTTLEELKAQAEKENRTLSNMVLICIQKYLDTAAK